MAETASYPNPSQGPLPLKDIKIEIAENGCTVVAHYGRKDEYCGVHRSHVVPGDLTDVSLMLPEIPLEVIAKPRDDSF